MYVYIWCGKNLLHIYFCHLNLWQKQQNNCEKKIKIIFLLCLRHNILMKKFVFKTFQTVGLNVLQTDSANL